MRTGMWSCVDAGMSFDFIIPGAEGSDRQLLVVGFPEAEFLSLGSAAMRAALPQLLRADDFYGLVEYSASDVGALALELDRLDPAVLGPSALDLVGRLRGLLTQAAALGIGVVAAGD